MTCKRTYGRAMCIEFDAIERVVIMHPGSKVAAADLPPHGKEEPPAASFRFPSFKEATEAYHRESFNENSEKRRAMCHEPPN